MWTIVPPWYNLELLCWHFGHVLSHTIFKETNCHTVEFCGPIPPSPLIVLSNLVCFFDLSGQAQQEFVMATSGNPLEEELVQFMDNGAISH